MDKFYRGFTAGVVAAIALNAWSLFSFHILNLTALRMLDWAAIFVYGHLPETLFQAICALLLQLLWSGFRGILFSYLFPDLFSQGYVGKAVIFSLILSFFESAIPKLYKVSHLSSLGSGTVLSAYIGAVLWGVLLAYFVRRFDGTKQPRKAG